MKPREHDGMTTAQALGSLALLARAWVPNPPGRGFGRTVEGTVGEPQSRQWRELERVWSHTLLEARAVHDVLAEGPIPWAIRRLERSVDELAKFARFQFMAWSVRSIVVGRGAPPGLEATLVTMTHRAPSMPQRSGRWGGGSSVLDTLLESWETASRDLSRALHASLKGAVAGSFELPTAVVNRLLALAGTREV